ncbi:Chitobiosyldiphosphodolichol beta-mannosyltransferase [Eumeta japonica]|uniref:Chitobiosyldiphosphodolichol beta-mannosyltransferase n=1 Tax=Eumeta variegata TaxID=151549 RepID=A0A4C1Y0V2_EUMVA|nr:Chitobiosyldiphosphodolichol beta-mannosyltransferase [Eumeta japonica]
MDVRSQRPLAVCNSHTSFLPRTPRVDVFSNFDFSGETSVEREGYVVGCMLRHILLKFATYIEKHFGQTSDHNICVTYAMKKDLLENWNIRATVLYDRPPTIFHPINLEEKHTWYMKISEQYPVFQNHTRDNLNLQPENNVIVERTTFTQLINGTVKYRNDRPGLLFSSTSWTQDEDFSILLEALQIYENDYAKKKLPKLICVITGKGPMKQHYEKIIDSRQWQHVKVVTPWLHANDYPTMVASADLGVCLHISSSGLDLPMKIVDMFGAGLPVCAYGFQW